MNVRRLLQRCALAAAATWLGLALAQSTDPGQMARDLGAQGNQSASQATSQPASTYPGYTTDNPPQTQYYNSGSMIQTQAQQVMATTPSIDPAAVVVNQATSGPQFVIAPTDPILTQGQTITSQATSLTQSYSGCQALTTGTPNSQQYSTKTCTVQENPATVNCTDTFSIACPASLPNEDAIVSGSISNSTTYSYIFPDLTLGTPVDNYWNDGGCTKHTETITFQVTPSRLASFKLTYAGYDDYMRVTLNGTQVFIGPYQGDMLQIVNGNVQYSSSGSTGGCELGNSYRENLSVDLKPYLGSTSTTPVSVTLSFDVANSGGGEGWIIVDIENLPDCSAYGSWTQSCPSSVTGCTAESTVCTSGPATVTVNGVPEYEDCWAEQISYLCESSQQQSQSACDTYIQNGCQQTASACVAYTATGACQTYQQTFRCPTSSGTQSSVTLCGGDLYCPDGNCTSDITSAAQSSATITQLATASTWLQAAQNAANDNTIASTGVASFFGGTSKQCTESAIGFSDCCSDSGWGTSLGLSGCSNDEKTLGQARQAGQAHEIGTYQTGSSLLKTTYDVFCVFNSMLSRIIQEQGRQQLGLDFGTPTSPNCNALTQTQMQSLDFNKMDFSEFYASAEATANTAMANMPTQTAIQQQLSQQLTYLMQNPGATSGTSGTSP